MGPTTDYLELSQYTGTAGAPYTSVRVTPKQIAGVLINQVTTGLEYVIYNQGNTLASGTQPYITLPYSATITGASMIVAPTGSVTADLWVCSYAAYDGGSTHPVASDSICGSHPLVISSGIKTTGVVSTWNTQLTQGSILAVNLSGIINITQASIILNLIRTLT